MKPAFTVDQQIEQLSKRGMLIPDIEQAKHFLHNISYYRLQGYWWDMQTDTEEHLFKENSNFNDVIQRYTFDRHLRIILFDAIERIEIAIRTKMIYHLSLAHSPLWYLNKNLFQSQDIFENNLTSLKREFGYSQEVFIAEHKKKHATEDAEAWKILEIASLGTLSKIYKNLNHQLPEKSAIAKDMGLNFHNELSSWLEAIVYVRNIVAHHSRLWSRNMVKKPIINIKNPQLPWLNKPIKQAQSKKPFLIISTMLYLCNKVTPNHQIKSRILNLFEMNPTIPIYKLGFFNDWQVDDIWI